MYDQRKYGKPFILPYGPPLGIAYLASTLEQNGADVKAVDMFDFSWDRFKILAKEQPDVVGITCLTEQRPSLLEVAKLSKTINKDCTVIMGGIHPTIMCEQILKNWPVDIVVLSEGEETIKELLDIVWDCETRVNFIWEDMLEWMIKSGCYCISFGVESASETVLKAIKKRPRRNKLNTPLNSQNRWA